MLLLVACKVSQIRQSIEKCTPKQVLRVSEEVLRGIGNGKADISCIILSHVPLSVTPLSARLFGVWNILSAVIRVKCAYDMKNERYAVKILTKLSTAPNY